MIMKQLLQKVLRKDNLYFFRDADNWLGDYQRVNSLEREDYNSDEEFIKLTQELCSKYTKNRPDPYLWSSLITKMETLFPETKVVEKDESSDGSVDDTSSGSGLGELKNNYPNPSESQRNINAKKLKR